VGGTNEACHVIEVIFEMKRRIVNYVHVLEFAFGHVVHFVVFDIVLEEFVCGPVVSAFVFVVIVFAVIVVNGDYWDIHHQ
jgi:hypothetical protein